LSRDQTGIKRKSNKNGTNPDVNIVNVVGKTFYFRDGKNKAFASKRLVFENKRLDLTVC